MQEFLYTKITFEKVSRENKNLMSNAIKKTKKDFDDMNIVTNEKDVLKSYIKLFGMIIIDNQDTKKVSLCWLPGIIN